MLSVAMVTTDTGRYIQKQANKDSTKMNKDSDSVCCELFRSHAVRTKLGYLRATNAEVAWSPDRPLSDATVRARQLRVNETTTSIGLYNTVKRKLRNSRRKIPQMEHEKYPN